MVTYKVEYPVFGANDVREDSAAVTLGLTQVTHVAGRLLVVLELRDKLQTCGNKQHFFCKTKPAEKYK